MVLVFNNHINKIEAFRKAMFLKPIINTESIYFIVSLRIIKAHISLWLVFNLIVLRLIIFLVIFTIQSYFLPTVMPWKTTQLIRLR